nr:sarcosine oxidase subunit gamma [Thalassovita mangrovi]
MKPITALGAVAPRVLETVRYSLRENDGVAFASLVLPADRPAPAVFGIDLPEPGKYAQGDAGKSAFWTARHQWMIEGASLAETDFAAALKAELPEGRVSEQTDGWITFDIFGTKPEAITALLERIVNLPAATLDPGCATRTSFEHMSAYFVRRSDTHLSVIGMRTLAGSLWHALETVIRRLDVDG